MSTVANTLIPRNDDPSREDRAASARSHAVLLGLDFVDLDGLELTTELASPLPEGLARSTRAVSIGTRPGRRVVALAVPTDFHVLARLRAELGNDVVTVVAESSQVERLLDALYGRTSTMYEAEAPRVAPTRTSPQTTLVEELVSRPVVNLETFDMDWEAATRIPESICRRHHLVGLGELRGRNVIAVCDPSDVVALDDLKALIGGDIELVVAPRDQIDARIARSFSRGREMPATTQLVAEARSLPRVRANDPAEIEGIDDAPIVQFVDGILRRALSERASDIHLEPTVDELSVRFRIDGLLRHAMSAPKAIQAAVVTRFKVMANLDIAEHRVPQDGRISVVVDDREIDMRIATLPIVNGEKTVVRILDRSAAPLDLDLLGFIPDVLERYYSVLDKPYGTILVAGPTGSGKSTTLYATLSRLNSPERNLVTVEDPPEYQLAGINQVQVNQKAGLHFATALRAILRTDPDVVLIGEIRDRETATIAIEAALTGHLVLSCLHTANAASTPIRLLEMGVEPFLVGSSLDCVLAQRLARVLCQVCSQPHKPSADELFAAGWDERCGAESMAFRRPVGCPACGHTGYRGRIAIQEVMLVSSAIESAVLSRAHVDEIERLAIAEGMRPLRLDGLRKAASGITSLEEIVRVIT